MKRWCGNQYACGFAGSKVATKTKMAGRKMRGCQQIANSFRKFDRMGVVCSRDPDVPNRQGLSNFFSKQTKQTTNKKPNECAFVVLVVLVFCC